MCSERKESTFSFDSAALQTNLLPVCPQVQNIPHPLQPSKTFHSPVQQPKFNYPRPNNPVQILAQHTRSFALLVLKECILHLAYTKQIWHCK